MSKIKNYLVLIFSSLITLPVVAAQYYGGHGYGTGISPLDGMFRIVGTVFNIPVLQNYFVQMAVFRLAIFAIVFRAVIAGAEKMGMDEKLGKIVGFFVALMGAFFASPAYIFFTGKILTLIIMLAIWFMIIGMVWYFAWTYKGPVIVSILVLVVLLYVVTSWGSIQKEGVAGAVDSPIQMPNDGLNLGGNRAVFIIGIEYLIFRSIRKEEEKWLS